MKSETVDVAAFDAWELQLFTLALPDKRRNLAHNRFVRI